MLLTLLSRLEASKQMLHERACSVACKQQNFSPPSSLYAPHSHSPSHAENAWPGPLLQGFPIHSQKLARHFLGCVRFMLFSRCELLGRKFKGGPTTAATGYDTRRGATERSHSAMAMDPRQGENTASLAHRSLCLLSLLSLSLMGSAF